MMSVRHGVRHIPLAAPAYFLCVTVGCATITRESTVTAIEATTKPRSQVVSVNGVPVFDAPPISQGDSVTLVTTKGRVALRPSDKVTIRTTYCDGDTIPNEGVVRARPSSGLIVAGVSMFAGGLAGMGITAWEANIFTHDLSTLPGAVAFLAVNGTIAAAGLALLIVGVFPRARVVTTMYGSSSTGWGISF